MRKQIKIFWNNWVAELSLLGAVATILFLFDFSISKISFLLANYNSLEIFTIFCVTTIIVMEIYLTKRKAENINLSEKLNIEIEKNKGLRKENKALKYTISQFGDRPPSPFGYTSQ